MARDDFRSRIGVLWNVCFVPTDRAHDQPGMG
jgi:hypothetical protein